MIPYAISYLFSVCLCLQTCLADLGSAVAALKEMRHTGTHTHTHTHTLLGRYRQGDWVSVAGVTKVVEQQLLPRVKAAVEAFSSVNHVLSEVSPPTPSLNCKLFVSLGSDW